MGFPASPRLTRRQALRQTFFYSAALALGGQFPALEAQVASPLDLHFLMLGDFGSLGQTAGATLAPSQAISLGATPWPGTTPTPNAPLKIPWVAQQQPVATAMQNYAQALRLRPEGLFLLGDNFYGSFKGGVNCPRWRTGFEEMYPKSVFPGPCWAMLGNHDYDEEMGQKLAAELDYARAHPGTRWTLPAKWYRVDWPTLNPVLTVLVLDSNYKNGKLWLTPQEKSAQLEWMTAELAKPRTAPWLVCMGHHPLYTNGAHGDNQLLIRDWEPLFQQYRVPFYFCGHDHDLQHLEFEGSLTSHVVSGGGGAHITQIRKPLRGRYSQSVNGFTHLQVARDKITVRHISEQGRLLHAFSKTLDGRVEILG